MIIYYLIGGCLIFLLGVFSQRKELANLKKKNHSLNFDCDTLEHLVDYYKKLSEYLDAQNQEISIKIVSLGARIANIDKYEKPISPNNHKNHRPGKHNQSSDGDSEIPLCN